MNLENTEHNSTQEPMLLMGCGILHKELRYLIRKNNWPFTLKFFDSSLHVNFHKLKSSLEKGLQESRELPVIVFYGACHPLIDTIVAKRKAVRTPGQNCVEILLGKETFTGELEKGAFFLLEDWAKRFDYVTGIAFDENPEVTREIFQLGHSYLLGLRTRCSGDFSDDAERVSRLVDLPLYWLDVDLDHLEQTMELTIEQRRNIS